MILKAGTYRFVQNPEPFSVGATLPTTEEITAALDVLYIDIDPIPYADTGYEIVKISSIFELSSDYGSADDGLYLVVGARPLDGGDIIGIKIPLDNFDISSIEFTLVSYFYDSDFTGFPESRYTDWFIANTNYNEINGSDTAPTFDTIKAKIQSLIDKSNTATGESDTDLTSAVDKLIGGYGQGGESVPNAEDHTF